MVFLIIMVIILFLLELFNAIMGIVNYGIIAVPDLREKAKTLITKDTPTPTTVDIKPLSDDTDTEDELLNIQNTLNMITTRLDSLEAAMTTKKTTSKAKKTAASTPATEQANDSTPAV